MTNAILKAKVRLACGALRWAIPLMDWMAQGVYVAPPDDKSPYILLWSLRGQQTDAEGLRVEQDVKRSISEDANCAGIINVDDHLNRQGWLDWGWVAQETIEKYQAALGKVEARSE